MAVLLKHHDAGHVVAAMMEHGLPETSLPGGHSHHKHVLPRSVAEICKVVNATKISLIKVG